MKDPLSNMWTGPVHFQGQMWPTREHAIVAIKLDRTSYLDKKRIRELVLDCKDGFQAKRLGKKYSNHHKIDLWHSVRRSTVFDMLIAAAFTDAQFFHCLLDPQIEEFHHVLPSGYRDPYWATPGENIHGKLLAGVRKSIITVATQLHQFLHHPYVIIDLNHIYLRQGVSLDMIPSIAGAIHLLYYPPPPIKQSALQSPPLKRPRYIQEALECTDVRLRDNPALAEEWKPKTKEPLPSQPSNSITPLLQIEFSRPITPEISNPTSVTPLLDLDPVPTSKLSIAPTPVPSLLDMEIKATHTRVQEVAKTFTSTSSAQIHRKYFCPLCSEQINRIKSHVVEVHLPYYVNVDAACFLCEHNYGTASNLSNHIQAKHSDRHGNIDNGASLATTYTETKYLHLITNFLNYLVETLELSTVSDLLSVLHNSPEAMPKSTWAPWLQWYEMKPTATEQYLMGQLSKFLHVTMPEEVQLMPPNTIVALLHWRPITALIKMLPQNKRVNLKAINSLRDGNGKLVSKIPTIVKPVLDVVDAHMHLDKFMQDTGHNNIQMDRLPSMKCCPTPVANLLFYVVNNAFLTSDLKGWELTPDMISDPKAKISYSIHPKTAGKLSRPELQQLLPMLRDHLLHSVALAEVGLDFSEVMPDSTAAEQQRLVLREQLKLAQDLQLPVTIHVRDRMFKEDAQAQCLDILSEVLTPQHSVYWHCFLGTLHQFNSWKEKFPNIFIGIGPKALNQANIESSIRDVFLAIPLNHILLETDAPLQVPRRYTRQVYPSPRPHPLRGNPYMVHDVAHFLAELFNIPLPVICSQTVQNSKNFFKC